MSTKQNLFAAARRRRRNIVSVFAVARRRRRNILRNFGLIEKKSFFTDAGKSEKNEKVSQKRVYFSAFSRPISRSGKNFFALGRK